MKGDTAYQGRAVGKVKIISNTKEITKMKKGDIMVTVATNPNLLPAMKKAAAIITDKGGIACHAAIIARELQIPCVIGTKIATQSLKDGQKVDVQADTGIVYIK